MEAISNWFGRFRARPDRDEEQAAREARKQAVVEKLARAIVARRLETPAVLFLELNRPLGFLFSQGAYFLRPFLGVVLPLADVEGAAEILDDPKAVDALLDRMQELSTRGQASG